MHIARRTDRYAQVISEPYDKAVYILDIFFGAYPVIRRLFGGQHEHVVAVGLYLQIVIEAGYLLYLIIAFALQIGLYDLASLAGASQYQTLAQFCQLAFGYARAALEIFEIWVGYELIKICGKYDNAVTRIIAAPGLAAQRITTKEPDDSMIEIAIAAIKPVIPENGEDILRTKSDV